MRVFLPVFTAVSPISAAGPVTCPPSTNLANFVVTTDHLDQVRKFSSGVLVHDEALRRQRAIAGPAEVAVSKVSGRKHNTRTEVLLRKPVQEPFCSANMDPGIQ
jgi:hypothetical protein